MEKRAVVLALAITLPLVLYGIPYAYAMTASSSYSVTSTYTAAANSIAPGSASCRASDYATGGGFALSVTDEVIIFSTSNILNGPNPTAWIVSVANHDQLFANTFSVTVICQTPITVAGISVPQFGSLYVAIALGAVSYFMLARRLAGRPTISTQS